MISSCWGVLTYDGQTDRRTDICDCRVAFATERVRNVFINIRAPMIHKIHSKERTVIVPVGHDYIWINPILNGAEIAIFVKPVSFL